MSISEQQEMLLSQLVDHELPADQANRVLAEAIDNAELRQRLKAMLQLREVLGSWQRQEPTEAIVALPVAAPAHDVSHTAWRWVSLAAAALLGGVLVGGGFLLNSRLHDRLPADTTALRTPPSPAPPTVLVTPEQQHEIARAFALHESVAGPLSWYAADDASIQVSPAQISEAAQEPIAVVVRLTPTESSNGRQAKTYVIVCRNNDPAAIELPQPELAGAVSFRLLPTAADRQISLQYAILADGADHRPDAAALAGRRHVGLGSTSLGQMALEDCLVNVDASAWVIRDEPKP